MGGKPDKVIAVERVSVPWTYNRSLIVIMGRGGSLVYIRRFLFEVSWLRIPLWSPDLYSAH